MYNKDTLHTKQWIERTFCIPSNTDTFAYKAMNNKDTLYITHWIIRTLRCNTSATEDPAPVFYYRIIKDLEFRVAWWPPWWPRLRVQKNSREPTYRLISLDPPSHWTHPNPQSHRTSSVICSILSDQTWRRRLVHNLRVLARVCYMYVDRNILQRLLMSRIFNCWWTVFPLRCNLAET